MMDESFGRARSPSGPQSSDDLAALCAAHAPVFTNGHFPSGTIFGDWRVTAFIGRGGNGEVYCAEHAALGTPAAVKVLVRDDESAKVRFEREARLLAGLKSASFPRFFAYGEEKGSAYIAMELLEPGDMPTGDRAVAKFMLKICEAVGELHGLGYIHRDIKPGNILWRRDGDIAPCHDGRAVAPRPPEGAPGRAACPHAAVPVLADLGLVKEIKPANSQLTNHPTTIAGVGTPGYGAPEQMERGAATEASDIHALGVMADQCFGGNPPQAWKRIVERATSSIPAHRYQSASALASAIRRRHLRRWIVSFAVVAIDLCGLAASAFIWWKRGGSEAWKWNSLCRRGMVDSVTTHYEPLGESHPAYPGYIVRHVTNSIEGVILRLSGRTFSFARPIRLKPGEYRIIGPGRIDADISGSSNVVVRIENCVFNNMTSLPYPKNGIRYELEGGAYLNFANLDKTYKSHRFIHSDSDAPNEVRFHGPLTIKELNEERNRETERILFPSEK